MPISIITAENTPPIENHIKEPTNLESEVRSSRINEDADYEPNNNIQDANLLNLKYDNNSYIFGNFSSVDQVDWFKFNVSKGDRNGNNADRFYFSLTDVATTTGVFMELYAPLPWPHKLIRSQVNDRLIQGQNPGLIELVSPVNGTFYLKICPNGTAVNSQETYVLSYGATKEVTNAAFDDDNSFVSPMVNWIEPHSESIAINEYLSAIWDIQDFYNFTGYRNQTLDIIMTPPVDSDFDVYIYQGRSIEPMAVSDKRGWGNDGEEKLRIRLPDDGLYYIRILAKVNNTSPDDIDNNRGTYKLDIESNVPPLWQKKAKTHYYVDEDAKHLFIEPEQLWWDLNKFDKLVYLIWNNTINNWEPRDKNDKIVSSVQYDKLKIQIINNGTAQYPNEVLKIIPNNNIYGVAELKIGAYDNPPEEYSEKNITIHILPLNDPPVINNTLFWEDQAQNAILEDDRITIFEFNTAQIRINAYDIEGDSLTYSAQFIDTSTPFSKEFMINPISGLITFYADYKFIGIYEITISVIDDGQRPDNQMTTRTIFIKISSFNIDYAPRTELITPINGSIVKNLRPTLVWNITDYDTPIANISYKIYLSHDISKVLSHSDDAIISEVKGRTFIMLTEDLMDSRTYFWTVIPEDGIFNGYCQDNYYSFKIDVNVNAPVVKLISPPNNMIFNYTDIELRWDLKTTVDSNANLMSDVYLGEAPNRLILIDTITINNYFPLGLKNKHTYYWQIVPKMESNSNFIEGEKSPVWKFSITKSHKPPIVNLEFPRDNSILKNNYLSFSWKVEYDGAEILDYGVYISKSQDFDDTPIDRVTEDTYFKVNDLEVGTYFWKIIPFVDEVPGIESEIWSFRIYPKVVQPIAIPKSPADNSTVTTNKIELKWTIEYTGSVAKVKYDVYLDSTTNDPAKMRLIEKDLRQLFTTPNEYLIDGETYYWRVVPTIVIEDGIVVGDFFGTVGTFKVDTSYRPTLNPKFNFSVHPTFLEIQPGNSKKITVMIENEGNIELDINISFLVEPDGFITLNLNSDRIMLLPGEDNNIEIEIVVPSNIKQNIFVITVKCEADQISSSNKEIMTLEIGGLDESKGEDEDISSGVIIAVVIIIIFILIILTILRNRSRKEQELSDEENNLNDTDAEDKLDSEKTNGTDRVPIPDNVINIKHGIVSDVLTASGQDSKTAPKSDKEIKSFDQKGGKTRSQKQSKKGKGKGKKRMEKKSDIQKVSNSNTSKPKSQPETIKPVTVSISQTEKSVSPLIPNIIEEPEQLDPILLEQQEQHRPGRRELADANTEPIHPTYGAIARPVKPIPITALASPIPRTDDKVKSGDLEKEQLQSAKNTNVPAPTARPVVPRIEISKEK
jgi:hypothetical protein